MGSPGHKAVVKVPGSPVAFTLGATTSFRQNQFTYSDPTTVDATTFPTNSNVAAISSGYIPDPGGGYFAGGVSFGDNSVERTAYKSLSGLSVGARYILSCYVIMGDNVAPDPGSAGSGKDFAFYFNGGDETSASAYTVTSVGSSVYRVSCPIIYGSGTAIGLHKQTGHSTKTFKASGLQLEKVPAYNSTVGTYVRTQGAPLYGVYRHSDSTRRVWDATATVTVLEQANGAKYSAPGAGAPAAQVNDVAWHPGGAYVAAVGSGGLYAWAWTDASGFGAQCSSIPTLPGSAAGYALAWSPAGDYLLVGHAGTAKFSVYPFNASTGTFSSALSSPVVTPDTVSAAAVVGVAWHPSDGSFALAFDATPGCYYYQLSAGVIGGAASPVGGTPGAAKCVSWNAAGTRLIVGHAGTATNQTYLSMWAWSGAASGALQSEPAAPPSAAVVSLSVHPSGLYVAYVDASNAYIKGYNLTSGTAWGAALTALALGGVANDVKFSPSGEHVAAANATANYLAVSPFAGAFAPLLAQPSTAAPGNGTAIGWSTTGKALGIGGGSSEYLHAYFFYKASAESWTPNRLDGWVQAAAASHTRQGILISTSYLPMSTLGSTREYSAKLERQALDDTVFGLNDETSTPGLRRVSGSIGRLKTTDTALLDGITTDTSLVLEIYKNSADTEPTRRLRVLIGDVAEEAPVKDIITEQTTFVGVHDADKRVLALPYLAI